MDLIKRLERTDDPIEIYRTQGQLKQFKIIENLPGEIERLDIALARREEYQAMKDENSKTEKSMKKGAY